MAAKKKPAKKSAKVKKPTAKRKPVQKNVRKKLATAKVSPRKKINKKRGLKKSAPETNRLPKKTGRAKTPPVSKTRARRKSQKLNAESSSSQELGSQSAGQSGDLQGLSNVEDADSQSVDELIEEGNAFEADVVAGVESADNADEKEVHTHEVPEDDVPGEYLDPE
jgi:hypothetical protein